VKNILKSYIIVGIGYSEMYTQLYVEEIIKVREKRAQT